MRHAQKCDIPYTIKNVRMTGARLPMHTCRPQGATLRKVRSLILRQYRFHRYFLRNKARIRRVFCLIRASYCAFILAPFSEYSTHILDFCKSFAFPYKKHIANHALWLAIHASFYL